MLQVILMGACVGLVLGIFMRQASIKRLPVRGGLPAQVFHYLASSTVSALIPVIFIAIFSGLPFLRVLLSGITFSASTWIFLLLYSFFENQAHYVEVQPQRFLD